jgi:hypothetical protein
MAGCKLMATCCYYLMAGNLLMSKGVFSSEIFGRNIPVALSLLFGKIYLTMN